MEHPSNLSTIVAALIVWAVMSSLSYLIALPIPMIMGWGIGMGTGYSWTLLIYSLVWALILPKAVMDHRRAKEEGAF